MTEAHPSPPVAGQPMRHALAIPAGAQQAWLDYDPPEFKHESTRLRDAFVSGWLANTPASVVTDDEVERCARAMKPKLFDDSGTKAGPLREYERDVTRSLARAALAASDRDVLVRRAYEEGVEDGIGWHAYPESGPKPQWINSAMRADLIPGGDNGPR